MTTTETRFADWTPDFCAYNAAYPEGVRDEYGYQYFLPVSEFKTENSAILIVGYAGADGIEFRLRAGLPGVWAYYPSEELYQLLGEDIGEVATGWMNESISV